MSSESKSSGNLFDDLVEIGIDIIGAMEEWGAARLDGDEDRIRRARAQVAFHNARHSVVMISATANRVLADPAMRVRAGE